MIIRLISRLKTCFWLFCLGTTFSIAVLAASVSEQSVDSSLRIEILDQRARALISADAHPQILADGFKWTEGPLWIDEAKAKGFLLFSDIPNNVILRYSQGEGVKTWLKPSGATGLYSGDSQQGSNGLLLDSDRHLVLMQQGDRRVARMESSLVDPRANFVTLAGKYDEHRLNSPNDGVFRSDGSLYFTDPAYGLMGGIDDPGKKLPFQGIYRLWPDGRLQLIDDSVGHPNGIGISPDEKTLYVAVSDEEWPVWLAYDLDDKGEVLSRREFFDASPYVDKLEGLPDGMAVHSSGILFATGPGGVWLFSPEGEVLARILTGKLTANCALSSDQRTLYITAHDTLMMLPLN